MEGVSEIIDFASGFVPSAFVLWTALQAAR
jgi:hypothetical protein